MGLRELKEVAHQQFVRGKFAQCAHTYQQVLRLAPRDPNMHVRHAEACRRAGERQQAIASYRTAAELLLELGCASRARGALRAALELDPRDPFLQMDIARLESNSDEPLSSGVSGDLPLLPPLESGLDPVPPPAPPHVMRATRAEDRLRTPALPPIHRALPSAQPIGPPVLLPPPTVRSESAGRAAPASDSRVEKLGAGSATLGYRPLPPRAKSPPPAPRQVTPSGPPPVLHPVDSASLPSRVVTPRPVDTGIQASALVDPASNLRAASSASGGAVVPPPPPAEALIGAARDVSLAQLASEAVASEPSRVLTTRLEVRRLSPSALAFRCSPNDSWAVIRSHTPLELHLVEDLEKLPPMMQDFPAELTRGAKAEGASNTVY